MSILIFVIASYILLSISLYMVFEKAGEAGWKGLVPGLNFIVWCRLIGRSAWHAIFLLIPIVNFFIYWGMCVDLVRSFRKYRFLHSAIAVIYAPAIFFYLGLNKQEKYDGPTLVKEEEYKQMLVEARNSNQARKFQKLAQENPYRKNALREWVEAIAFAVFAAAFIRMFLIEAYTIPTSSMEGSLLVGDYLFVSKANYGIRTPMTILQIPLLHNKVPLIGGESYFKSPNLPYYRLPAFDKIENNDPVVFNWPAGDEVFLRPDRSIDVQQTKNAGQYDYHVRNFKLVKRPVDKTDFYIKRCIATPGDSLRIINKKIFINGEEIPQPEKVQFAYTVDSKSPLNQKSLRDLRINESDIYQGLIYMLNQEQVDKLREIYPEAKIKMLDFNQPEPQRLFPQDTENFPSWSNDYYGPIWMPEKGTTIPISNKNIALYERIISNYEGHELEKKGDEIWIDGEKADTYTFAYDYYWMMGDNRHNSEDSRVWGFVPETHIVGKPLFIWFSTKNGIRWDRIFQSANPS